MFWDNKPSEMVYTSFYLLVSCYILIYIGCIRPYLAVFGRPYLVVGRINLDVDAILDSRQTCSALLDIEFEGT